MISEKNIHISLIFITSLIVRSYNLSKEYYVKWDEKHFINFARIYLLKNFYFDVHPPLGILILAFLSYLYNLDTSFEYPLYADFPFKMKYFTMKFCHCIIGSLILVFFYLILEMNFKKKTAFFTSLILIFEFSFVFISRMLVIDVYLLFFIVLNNYFFMLYHLKGKNINLIWLGICLGMLVSVKWNGLFTFSHIGLYFLTDFYTKIKKDFFGGVKIFVKYFIFLIFLPGLVYLLVFYVHFLRLTNDSNELSKMSSVFRANYFDLPEKNIKFGTPIAFKNTNLNGGVMQMYEIDGYDLSIVYDYNGYDKFSFHSFVPSVNLQTNSFVTIFSLGKGKFICVRNKVSGCTTFNPACVFVLRSKNRKRIHINTNTSFVSIYNPLKECYLQPKKDDLTKLICEKDEHFWSIESFTSPKFSLNLITFFKMFYESNKRMYFINQSFKHNYDLKLLSFVSFPNEWPFFTNKIQFLPTDKPKFMFSTNKPGWFFSTISILILPFYFFTTKNTKKLNFKFYFIFLGYFFNFLPFFFLKRIMYFHHYLPALIYSTMGCAFVFEWVYESKFFILIIIYYFLKNNHLIYGY